MDVERIDRGLWRWTAPHPEWKTGDDWGRDVGCVYWETDDAIVLIDPLVPNDPGQRSHLLASLDKDVERVGRPVTVLLTCEWHARSSAEVAGRYGGRVVAPAGVHELPIGVAAIAAPVAEEVVYWLPGPRAAVPGDTLLGSDEGLTLCPESWLEGRGGLPQLRRDLAPLLDLPVDRVLTSHGPPVLSGGHDALVQALGAA